MEHAGGQAEYLAGTMDQPQCAFNRAVTLSPRSAPSLPCHVASLESEPPMPMPSNHNNNFSRPGKSMFPPRPLPSSHGNTMAFPALDAYLPKRKSKAPPHRRRATVDAAPSRGSLARPRRRNSLPQVKKAVQFSDLSEVVVVEPLAAARPWYSGEDHRRFKQERITDVVRFRTETRQKAHSGTGGSSGASSCPVGLEQLLSSRGMRETQSTRKVVIKSVLVEQRRQQAVGMRDPDQIAFLSVRLTAEASEGAVKRGKFQEMAKFI